jgi:hypothetical protein
VISKENKISFGIAGVHFVLFVAAAIYIASVEDGQAPMLWGLFFFIDYPVSYLAVMVREPHIIFGVLGTAWWYFLARIFLQLLPWIGNRGNNE